MAWQYAIREARADARLVRFACGDSFDTMFQNDPGARTAAGAPRRSWSFDHRAGFTCVVCAERADGEKIREAMRATLTPPRLYTRAEIEAVAREAWKTDLPGFTPAQLREKSWDVRYAEWLAAIIDRATGGDRGE